MLLPPPSFEVFFDGHTARRHKVRVRPTEDGAALALLAEGAEAEVLWPLTHLRRQPDEADAGVLTLTLHRETEDETPRDPARLILRDAGMRNWVIARAPALTRRDVRKGTATKIAGRLLDDGLTELSFSGGRLLLPGMLGVLGQTVRLRIPAQDVILSKEAPTGLSALNVLPVVITRNETGRGAGVAVGLRAGEDQLLARITRRSAHALGLAPGMQVWAVVKSVAVAPVSIGEG